MPPAGGIFGPVSATGIGRWIGGLLPGARARRHQIERYDRQWVARNELLDDASPLWVVLGDSTAQAIGASSINLGYVGGVLAWLAERDGVDWHVLNLSRTGARIADVTTEQLPRLRAVPPPDLVSCAVGTNDLLRRTPDLETKFTTLMEALPPRALVANLPRGLRTRQAAQLNQQMSLLVEDHDLRLVDLWAVTGPPWRGKFSTDQFHPNDLGYRAWTEAFTATLATEAP